MTPADQVRITAETLAEHLWHHTRTTHCACGWRSPLGQLVVDGHTAHVAAAVVARLQAELGDPVVEWAVVDNGQVIHIAGATSPADALAGTHGHSTHGPIGVARRTVTRTPWEHLPDTNGTAR